MLEKIKANLLNILEIVIVIVSGAFLFERSRRESDDALVANQKTLTEVDKDKQQVASNDGQLQEQQAQREEIKKEAADEKSSDSDATSFLNKR